MQHKIVCIDVYQDEPTGSCTYLRPSLRVLTTNSSLDVFVAFPVPPLAELDFPLCSLHRYASSAWGEVNNALSELKEGDVHPFIAVLVCFFPSFALLFSRVPALPSVSPRCTACSISGVSTNMSLAKLVGAHNKPSRQTVLLPQHRKAFLSSLPLQRLPGVGRSFLR